MFKLLFVFAFWDYYRLGTAHHPVCNFFNKTNCSLSLKCCNPAFMVTFSCLIYLITYISDFKTIINWNNFLLFNIKVWKHKLYNERRNKSQWHNILHPLSPSVCFLPLSNRSYDQMSVSTECEADWEAHSQFPSMISLDMTQPSSPISPSKFFKVGFMFVISHYLVISSYYLHLNWRSHRFVCVCVCKNKFCSNHVTANNSPWCMKPNENLKADCCCYMLIIFGSQQSPLIIGFLTHMFEHYRLQTRVLVSF